MIKTIQEYEEKYKLDMKNYGHSAYRNFTSLGEISKLFELDSGVTVLGYTENRIMLKTTGNFSDLITLAEKISTMTMYPIKEIVCKIKTKRCSVYFDFSN